MRTFDTADFPFSYLEATAEGRCLLTPGFNLTTVGTVRDGAKWPARDRRQGNAKRDRITFDVFSPLTVGRMMGGVERLGALYEKAERKVEIVSTSGVDLKRVLLKTGMKFYRSAIDMYLLEKVLARAEQAIAAGNTRLADALAESPEAVFSEAWVDIGGQMMPRGRVEELTAAVEEGRIADLDALGGELDRIQAAYAEDEWAWVRWAYAKTYDKDLDGATPDDLVQVAEKLVTTRSKYLKMVLHDAGKEFGAAVQTGFGQGGDDDDIAADFASVRGYYETNKFVRQLEDDIAALTDRLERFKQAVIEL